MPAAMKVSSRITLFPLWVQAAASDFAERQVSLTIYLNFERRLSDHLSATIDGPPNKLAEISNSARSNCNWSARATRDFPKLLRVAHYQRKRDTLSETKCEACSGTGLQVIKQPTRPGKRIYAPKCNVCGGKGRVKSSTE